MQILSRLFGEWLRSGVLVKDSVPALYFYEQRFKDHGKIMVRRGFFAALKLENPHGGSVKPHERTLAKPKEDRMKLLKAVKANLSPVFGLSTIRAAEPRSFAGAYQDSSVIRRPWTPKAPAQTLGGQ